MNLEKREELREEALRDAYHERMMYEDMDYALEYVADDIDESYHNLLKVCKVLNEYGYEFTPIELLKEI